MKGIDKATHHNTIYYRAAKPYLDAKKFIIQAENYSHLDAIMKLYDQVKIRAEEKATV